MRNFLAAVVLFFNTTASQGGFIGLTQIGDADAKQNAQAALAAAPKLKLNFENPDPIEPEIYRPDFETEVLVPLRKYQAEEEARAKRESEAKRLAAIRAAKTVARVTVASGDVWEALRKCESGGDYASKRNPRYRGAYQYDYATWSNYAGYVDPADAPPAVQDAKAQETQARRGWSPWPACARKLGLL